MIVLVLSVKTVNGGQQRVNPVSRQPVFYIGYGKSENQPHFGIGFAQANRHPVMLPP